MGFTKVPEENKEMLRKVVEAVPDAQKRTMFGSPVYFIAGNMLIGAHQGEFFLRLPQGERDRVIGEGKATPFSPAAGMTMKEYVAFSPEYLASEEFWGLLEVAEKYVNSLPPKEKKKKKILT